MRMNASYPTFSKLLPVLERPQTELHCDHIASDPVDSLVNSSTLSQLIGQKFLHHKTNTLFRVNGLEISESEYRFLVQYENERCGILQLIYHYCAAHTPCRRHDLMGADELRDKLRKSSIVHKF